jgi:hypothetical protein
MTDLVLRCTGRLVDDNLQPVGDPCGRVLTRPTTGGWMYVAAGAGDIEAMDWTPIVPVDDEAYIVHARSAGWSVGPNGEATCPACRRPAAGLLRDIAALERRAGR